MPTTKDRIQKLEEILTILKENGGKVKFGKLFGTLALKYGVTEKTFWDYLEALRLAGKIEYSTIYTTSKKDELEIKLLGGG